MITLAQFVVFSGYLAIIYKKFDILQSISHSTYEWKDNEKYYFTAMCVTLGILNLFQGMGAWGIFTTFGLLAVGVTVNFLDDSPNGSYDMEVHTAGAILLLFAPFLGLLFDHGIWIPFAVFAVGVTVIMLKAKINYVYYIEIIALPLILIGYELR